MIAPDFLLRRLAQSQRGVSAVEFALILPIFVGLMGAGIEISSLMIANMKVQRLATMTADMVAQSGSSESRISEAQIYDILSAMDLAAQPLDIRGHGRVIISAVMGEDTRNGGEANVNRIKWQRFDGSYTAASSVIGCWSSSDTTNVIGRQLRLGEPLFHAQVSYVYQPIFNRAFVKWFNVPETITHTATYRGRGAIYRPPLDVENYPPKQNCNTATGL